MDRRFGFVFAIAFVMGAVVLPAAAAPAPEGPHPALQLEWHLGDDFVAAFLPGGAPALAASGSGEIFEISAMGDIDVVAKTATGEGGYVWMDEAGVVLGSGRIAVEGLVVVRSFGDGTAQGLPAVFQGGFAAMRVLLHPSGGGGPLPGVLWVESALGKVPPGQDDPFRLSLEGGPNFNENVRGGAIFLALE